MTLLLNTRKERRTRLQTHYLAGTILFQRIIGSWQNDLELQELIKKIQSKEEGNNGYSYDKQHLRKNGRLVVGNDAELRRDLIQQWHDLAIGGHSGTNNTY